MKRLGLIGILVALAAPAAARAQGTVPYRGIQGFTLAATTTPGDVEQQLSTAQALGANTVRIEVPWARIEPRAHGQFDQNFLAIADQAFSAAAAHGLKALVVIDSTPCWASAAPASIRGNCSPAPDSVKAESYPPMNPADFAAIVGFVVGRYGDRMLALEVWNEPDQANEFYFAGPDKPHRYAEMLKAAYTASKQANPKVLVLGGSLVGANGAFLRALYAEGIQGHYDGLSVHYYDLALASLRAIRAVQKQHHDSKPLWLAEFGWDSCLPGPSTQGGQRCFTPDAAAADIGDVFRQLPRASYVQAAILYTLYDTAQYDFGVFDRAGNRKPTYFALLRALSHNDQPLRPLTAKLTRKGGSVTIAGSAPAGDNVQLTIKRGGRRLFAVAIAPSVTQSYSYRLPRGYSSRGRRVLVQQLWSGLHVQRTIR